MCVLRDQPFKLMSFLLQLRVTRTFLQQEKNLSPNGPEGSCTLTDNFVDESCLPPFSQCTTQPRSLQQDRKYLANVFCIIKEANPIMPVMTRMGCGPVAVIDL